MYVKETPIRYQNFLSSILAHDGTHSTLIINTVQQRKWNPLSPEKRPAGDSSESRSHTREKYILLLCLPPALQRVSIALLDSQQIIRLELLSAGVVVAVRVLKMRVTQQSKGNKADLMRWIDTVHVSDCAISL